MKLGILGTGNMVHMALPALTRLGAEKLFLLAREHSREKAEGLRDQYGLDGVFYDYDALLSADIDAVYAALPNLVHFEYAQRALLAGKHVMVEKPAVVSVREWEQLQGLAQSQGVRIVEAMTVHQLPGFQAMREWLPRIGRPRLALLNYSQRSSRYDAFLQGNILPAFDPAQAGGALMDLNVYNLHALLGLFGKPRGVDYRANLQRGIDTSGVLTLDYGDFQAVAVGAKDCQGPSGGVIQGEEGFLRFTGPVSGVSDFEFVDNQGNETPFRAPEGDRLEVEFRRLFQLLRGEDPGELDRLGELSAAAAGILETARAGVKFPGDEGYQGAEQQQSVF